MSWDTPTPAAISAMRSMLLACPSLVAAGIDTARVHYPSATPFDDGEALDPLPLVEIDRERADVQRIAAGGGLTYSGQLMVTILADLSVAELEDLADAVGKELISQETGLPLGSPSVGRCTDITRGAEAVQDDDTTQPSAIQWRSITLAVPYGME